MHFSRIKRFNLLSQFVLFLISLTLGTTQAQTNSQSEGGNSKLLRIGGEYTIKKRAKNKDNSFTIVFESIIKTGMGDRIILYSDHIHIGIKVGDQIRISAEVHPPKGSNDLDQKSEELIAYQVLLFLPQPEGHAKVWLLSREGANRPLQADSYLKMHYPQSDYLIL